MRKVALLEKTKTPYRQPLFDYVGLFVDLTVYYVGKTPSRRQWNTQHNIQNYRTKEFNGYDVGPYTIVPELKRHLIQENYDEIIASSTLNMIPNSYIAASAAEKSNALLTIWTEFVLTPWINGYNRPDHIKFAKTAIDPIDRYIRRRLFQYADSVIAYSRLAGQAAVAMGANKSSVSVAPQWYPPEKLSSFSPKNDKSDSFRVLSVGELSRLKGIDVLLEVASNYDGTDGIEFAIAGSGALQNHVSKGAKQNKHISALGYIEGQQKAFEFANADLFVLPSRHDAWGMVVNEAYISDTPVVATNTAGAEMIVPENFTVTPGNIDDLTRAIENARYELPTAPDQPSLNEMATPIIDSVEERSLYFN